MRVITNASATKGKGANAGAASSPVIDAIKSACASIRVDSNVGQNLSENAGVDTVQKLVRALVPVGVGLQLEVQGCREISIEVCSPARAGKCSIRSPIAAPQTFLV